MFSVQKRRLAVFLLVCACVCGTLSCGSAPIRSGGPSITTFYPTSSGEQPYALVYPDRVALIEIIGPGMLKPSIDPGKVNLKVEATMPKFKKGSRIGFYFRFKNTTSSKLKFFARAKNDQLIIMDFEACRLEGGEPSGEEVTARNAGTGAGAAPIKLPLKASATEIEEKLISKHYLKITLNPGEEREFTFRFSRGRKGLKPIWNLPPGKYRITMPEIKRSVDVEIKE